MLIHLFYHSFKAIRTDCLVYELETYIFIIIGEGETALVGLMHYFEGKESLEAIPNLIFIGSDNEILYAEQIVEDFRDLAEHFFQVVGI